MEIQQISYKTDSKNLSHLTNSLNSETPTSQSVMQKYVKFGHKHDYSFGSVTIRPQQNILMRLLFSHVQQILHNNKTYNIFVLHTDIMKYIQLVQH